MPLPLNRPQSHTTTLFLITPLLLLTVAFLLSSSFLSPSSFTPLRRLALLTTHLSPFSTTTTTTAKMSTTTYSHELLIAQLAVQRATLLTKLVFSESSKGTLSKDDASPVTIGDFGAQALIISALRHNFPSDAIVAEEEAAPLRADANLASRIFSLVAQTSLSDEQSESLLGGPITSEESMLDLIDGGRSQGGRSGRIWTIDPIDGTKGFLRGGQYAVCLGLLVDGEVAVGVLGCPNLPVDDAAPLTADLGSNQTAEGEKGVLFSAAIGQGSTSRPLTSGPLAEGKTITVSSVTDTASASFCESYESGHSNQSGAAAIAARLGITKPSVRMDSQAKYGSVARGAGDILLRLPTSKTYQEKIWDHAAGDLVVREAGGQVTDTLGRRLDFGHGRTLASNSGVVAAPAAIHGKVLEAVQEVLGLKGE